ncbi:helix-turn-helix transcriptional regulator [Kitasatospora sp. NPDC086791]|uniref:helix-turn-helix transcriptional regulator n=1 Tax=Kitasatospora sp. NPDC086791 TaxID=3155178 RepID=UPI0034202D76
MTYGYREATSWQHALDTTMDQLAGLLPLLQVLRQEPAAAPPGGEGRGGVGTVVEVAGTEAVRGLLGSLAAHARSQVSWLSSIGQAPEEFFPLLARSAGLLAPGVGLLAVLDQGPGASPAAGRIFRLCDSGGARVRVSGSRVRDLLLVDGDAVVLPDRTPGGELRVTVSRDPVTVGLAQQLFEAVWVRAAPPRREPGAEPSPLVEDRVKREILALLAAGAKDEQIARRTGLSLRTCRRHVAAILQELGAVSRFQAGVQAVGLGLVRPEC